jgi:hypothetical protein
MARIALIASWSFDRRTKRAGQLLHGCDDVLSGQLGFFDERLSGVIGRSVSLLTALRIGRGQRRFRRRRHPFRGNESNFQTEELTNSVQGGDSRISLVEF